LRSLRSALNSVFPFPTYSVIYARTFCFLLLFLAVQTAEARVGRSTVYDPPADYYQSAQGLVGAGLKAALHQRIKGHRVLSYGSSGTAAALRVLDAMPGNSSQVRLLYWGTGRAGSKYGGSVGDWNHEHCWPQAYGVDGGAGKADVHNLRPCDVQANGERANLYYAEITGGEPADRSPLCVKTAAAWMPRPEEKGDLARAMFYMAVRYEGGESTPDLELSDTPNAGANRFGRLSDLLRWHREDPVDDEERRRNHLVYTDYQYNRNPFVDDPDYVEMVFRGVPVVRVTAVQAVATEGLEEAVVRISRRGPVTQSLTVPLVYDGTAEPGEWEETPSAVTIPAGAAAVDLVLAGRPQSGEQGLRTLLVAAGNSASYAPVDGPAELALLDAPAKGVPQMVTWPVAGPATEGMTLSEITLTGGQASVPGTFAFATGQIVPPVGSSWQQVVFTPTNTAAYETLTLVVEVQVDPQPADGFVDWLQGEESSPDTLNAYAIGGASGPSSGDGQPPRPGLADGFLLLEAVVRTDDPALTVMAESSGNLAAGVWSGQGILIQGAAEGVPQTGVPAGCERRVFRVTATGDARFLRLQAVLAE
jgi:endonuclease I